MRHWISSKLGCAVLTLSPFIFMRPAQAQSYVIMYEFTGPDGAVPFGNLLLNQGVLYGTTSGGGANNAGTVFQFDVATEVETVIYSFAGGPADGADPVAGLVQDANGNFYGVTYGGGASFFGTVFKISATGDTFTTLYSFLGPPDGAGPSGTLLLNGGGPLRDNLRRRHQWIGNRIRDRGWRLCEGSRLSAWRGDAPRRSGDGERALLRHRLLWRRGFLRGTLFELSVAAPLYEFTGGADGGRPMASLIGDGAGNLYGTASEGGSGTFGEGNGVVFKLDVNTNQRTVLHTFAGLDGTCPAGALVRDSSGNLYGTTMFGGGIGYGTVFKLDTSGNLTTLHDFTGGPNGGNPVAGLVLDTDGNLWGVASAGGFGYGMIFEIPAGT
jgi:uncharacterized repeat protein (TIGR03803 family)